MEGSKKRSTSGKKKVADTAKVDTTAANEFVEDRKKRATVKQHGIDNVRVTWRS